MPSPRAVLNRLKVVRRRTKRAVVLAGKGGLLIASLLAASSSAHADEIRPKEAPRTANWPDTFTARLEALALLQSLNANLLSNASATETLRQWCAEHRLDGATTITAQRVQGPDKPADAAVRAALGAAPGEPVRYRRVRLACGQRVLSEADNWYLPGKLSEAMNRRLDETDTPFGVVVKSLNYSRRTLSAALLYNPLPEGWDLSGDRAPRFGDLLIPHQVLQHRAVLITAAGEPFSLVVETYTDKVLPDRAP